MRDLSLFIKRTVTGDIYSLMLQNTGLLKLLLVVDKFFLFDRHLQCLKTPLIKTLACYLLYIFVFDIDSKD